MKRRDVLGGMAGAVASLATTVGNTQPPRNQSTNNTPPQGEFSNETAQLRNREGTEWRAFNSSYQGAYLEHVAFPMGGIGAGMVCLEGSGSLAQMSLWHRLESAREPGAIAALSIKGPNGVSRVLEGPVSLRKRRPDFSYDAVSAVHGTFWGLPRFRRASFTARFPFGEINLSDDAVPLSVQITGWSPFEPNDPDNASLPVAGLEYLFVNTSSTPVEAVFSFHAPNFMADRDIDDEFATPDKRQEVRPIDGGFELIGRGTNQEPWRAGSFAVWIDDPSVNVNSAWPAWARTDIGGFIWREIQSSAHYKHQASSDSSIIPGASLSLPFSLAAGESRTVGVRLAWFIKHSNLKRNGSGSLTWVFGPERVENEEETYKPWYVGHFGSVEAVTAYWRENYNRLRANSDRFSQALLDSTIPPEVLEAVSANLTILKSPTVLRQDDGRFWAWEGSFERNWITTEGTNTHVWNYAQSLPHLFSSLELTIRETEFGPNQRQDGHQDFRAALPIRPTNHTFLAAADGQLGGIMKIYRDWRISGNTVWLRGLWPRVRASLDYCIRTWDPKHNGLLEEPHHNTFDVEFWGPDGMCTSYYLGALKAAVLIGKALDDEISIYANLLKRGTHRVEGELFNGEYFFQRVRWRDLNARYPIHGGLVGSTEPPDPEEHDILHKEGPPYQYGAGCLASGIAGSWLAWVCGVGQVIDASKVKSHLEALYRYNFKRDLSTNINTQGWARPSFGFGDEGGLVTCTWPNGGRPARPFQTAGEVWTGFEYVVASHLIQIGSIEKGLDIVRACRKRYDGRFRNPFDELEAGHWYARAMSSYALLQVLSGARFDAVNRVLYLNPRIKGDYRCFLSTATGYGTVGVRQGQPFVEVVSGTIPYSRIDYSASSA